MAKIAWLCKDWFMYFALEKCFGVLRICALLSKFHLMHMLHNFRWKKNTGKKTTMYAPV